jgi:hypothetical protein
MELMVRKGLSKLAAWRRLGAVCVGVATVVSLGVTPAAARAPGNPAPEVGHAFGQFTVRKISTSEQQPSSELVCNLSKGIDNRTQACALGAALVRVRNLLGVQIGSVAFEITQEMLLNPRSRSFSEVIKVLKVVKKGTTPAFGMNLFVSCGSTCSVTYHWPEGALLAVGTHGTISYKDTVAKGKENTFKTSYVLTLVASGYTPVQFSYNYPVSVRCDDMLSEGFVVAGCVFPSVIPTLTLSRAGFGASAAMIQWAQEHLTGAWGLRGKGKPLSRLANTKQRDINRGIICGRAWRPDTPWVADKGKVTVKDSCDEFPFAATRQSGALKDGKTDNSFSGAKCAQVKAVKTADSGSAARIWNDVEVIGTYNKDARCVRGHIPLSLNTDAGSKAWKAFIASDRLLDEDKFWVSVTA